MTCRGATLVVSLIGLTLRAGPDKPPPQETGFQEEVPVRQATRLDWTFAAASLGPDGVKLPDSYDSTRQKYQSVRPADLRRLEGLAAGAMRIAGRRRLRLAVVAEDLRGRGGDLLRPYGIGNNVAPALRVRVLLDAAGRRASPLSRRSRPDVPGRLRRRGSASLRHRLRAAGVLRRRGRGGRRRGGQRSGISAMARARSAVRRPARARGKTTRWGRTSTTRACAARCGPTRNRPADEVYDWLAADLDRRRAEARARPGLAAPDEAYTNLQQATLAVDAARAELTRPDGVYRAATLLEGIDARWGRTQPAEAARALLQDLRADPPRRKKWEDERDAEERRSLAAQARLAERLGDVRGRCGRGTRWRRRTRDAPEGKKASEEVKRLTTALAAAPYLGLTVDGEFVVQSVAPDGPAAAGRAEGRRPAGEAGSDHAGDDGRPAGGRAGAQAGRRGRGGRGPRRADAEPVREGGFSAAEGVAAAPPLAPRAVVH